MFISRKIFRDQLAQYEGMIPDTYMKQIKLNKFYAGVLVDVLRTEEVPRAVFITYFIDGWLELVWFGYFDQDVLPIEKAYVIESVIMAEKKRYGKDVNGVFFEIHEDEVGDKDLFRQALMMCGFRVRETLGNVYEFSLNQVREKEQQFLAKAAQSMKCILVSSADEGTKEALDNMIREDARPVPVGMYINWADYLVDESLICMKDDKPCGTLLLSKKGQYLILDCAYVADRMALSAMLGRAFFEIKKKYGDDQKILVPIVLEKTGLLVEKLAKDAIRGKRLEFVKYL
ncbi:MAG: hypothetical protein K6B14_00025 [Lachnospiraceae bacterium]|nr:hypothetical protein [Lachnospiraceae bacterium]